MLLVSIYDVHRILTGETIFYYVRTWQGFFEFLFSILGLRPLGLTSLG